MTFEVADGFDRFAEFHDVSTVSLMPERTKYSPYLVPMQSGVRFVRGGGHHWKQGHWPFSVAFMPCYLTMFLLNNELTPLRQE
jgi:hypothetical protein